MPEERITGSKIDLDLFAQLTYRRVYMVQSFIVTEFKTLYEIQITTKQLNRNGSNTFGKITKIHLVF